jgi:hypothetical protein
VGRRFPKPQRHSKFCHYCDRRLGTLEVTWDHVVPKALGGPNVTWNRVTSCGRCNQKKADTKDFRDHCETCQMAWRMFERVDESAWFFYGEAIPTWLDINGDA